MNPNLAAPTTIAATASWQYTTLYLVFSAFQYAIWIMYIVGWFSWLGRHDLRYKKSMWLVITLLPLFITFYAYTFDWDFLTRRYYTIFPLVFISLSILPYYFLENRKKFGYLTLAFLLITTLSVPILKWAAFYFSSGINFF